MKNFWIILLLLSQSLLLVAEDPTPRPPTPRLPIAPRAWLGLDVSKPDETITAHLPALPPGIGFVIRSVDEKGPAVDAGLHKLDVLWKMNEQWLVNEGQLAALLRLSKPGDEVTLTGFRAGQPLEVKLKLGEAPASNHPFPGDFVESSILPSGASGPMRVVNVAEKLASYSTTEGRAEVRKNGTLYHVKITDPKNTVIFEDDLTSPADFAKVPSVWNRRIMALRRGLDLALEGGIASVRQPRPRVVPPPNKNP